MVNKAATAMGNKDHLRKQKKIQGVFTNYGGALSNNSGEGQGSSLIEIQKTGGSANRMFSNNGSVNSDGSKNGHQKQRIVGTDQTAHP